MLVKAFVSPKLFKNLITKCTFWTKNCMVLNAYLTSNKCVIFYDIENMNSVIYKYCLILTTSISDDIESGNINMGFCKSTDMVFYVFVPPP